MLQWHKMIKALRAVACPIVLFSFVIQVGMQKFMKKRSFLSNLAVVLRFLRVWGRSRFRSQCI